MASSELRAAALHFSKCIRHCSRAGHDRLICPDPQMPGQDGKSHLSIMESIPRTISDLVDALDQRTVPICQRVQVLDPHLWPAISVAFGAHFIWDRVAGMANPPVTIRLRQVVGAGSVASRVPFSPGSPLKGMIGAPAMAGGTRLEYFHDGKTKTPPVSRGRLFAWAMA